jgi:CheY-like chemotaxis protein
MTLVTILKDINHNLVIVEAQNGKIAVDKFKEAVSQPCGCPNRGFKLVLMDIQMPVMDGFDATKEIIKLKYEPCSILALTCYTAIEKKN